MAINAAKEYVVPAGVGLLKGLFGPDYGNGNWPSPMQGMFDTGDGRGAYGPVTDAWNAQRLGYGVLPAPGQLSAALMETTGRYMGGPQNAGWSDRWNTWNATDVTDPNTGRTLLSPMHQTGLRVGQDYGVERDPRTGQVAGPAEGQLFNAFTWTQNKLSGNPYLDPANANAGYRGLMESSPYETPEVAAYLEAMSAAGGPDDVDYFGQRGLQQNRDLAGGTDFDRYGLEGIDRTNALATQNLRKLTRGIDREAENTLATKLPEIQRSLQAAGLGRSGASQMALLQAQNEVMSQANRDKQRTLADFQRDTLGRQADAINLNTQQGFAGAGQKYGTLAEAMNLGSTIGAQGREAYAGRMGNAALAGLGDRFSMNEANRAGERALWSQNMGEQAQRYGLDLQGYLGALEAGGRYSLGAMDQERLGQDAALNSWLGLQDHRETTRRNSMQEMLSIADQERALRQERLNQMISASYLPLDIMSRIATGTTAPAGPQGGSTSPWGSFLPGLAANAAQGMFGGGSNVNPYELE